MNNLDDLKVSLKAIFEKKQVAMKSELTTSHYVFQTNLVKARLWKLLIVLDTKISVMTYNAFLETHKAHIDHVCFRVVVFCKYLAYFCQDHKVRCNVNEFSSLRPKFHIWLKVEYRSSRWHTMLEVMFITPFFFRPHIAFMNEFS